jgi:hypothetical protein
MCLIVRTRCVGVPSVRAVKELSSPDVFQARRCVSTCLNTSSPHPTTTCPILSRSPTLSGVQRSQHLLGQIGAPSSGAGVASGPVHSVTAPPGRTAHMQCTLANSRIVYIPITRARLQPSIKRYQSNGTMAGRTRVHNQAYDRKRPWSIRGMAACKALERNTRHRAYSVRRCHAPIVIHALA